MIKTKKKIGTCLFAFMLLFVSIFCCSKNVYAYTAFSNKTISWLQAANSTKTLASYNFTDGNYIRFEGVATSPTTGTFKVKLQKKGVFAFHDVSNVYTVTQKSSQSTNTRTGEPVSGQYFKLVWTMSGTGTYRVVLYSPSKPQSTVISQSWLYSANN